MIHRHGRHHAAAAHREPGETSARRTFIRGFTGRLALLAVVGATAGAVVDSVGHYTAQSPVPAATAPAVPALPKSAPNFNPVLNPHGGEQQYDVQTQPFQADSTAVTWPEYIGFARETNTPGVVRLLAGADVIPEPNGGLDIKPLNGPRDIRLSPETLRAGPADINLGGDYRMIAGANSIDGAPEVFFGPKSQQPEPGTFIGQP